MRPTSILPLVLLAGPADAQTFHLPATRNPAAAEMNSATPFPFMCQNSHLQQFYEASEVGASSLLVRRVSFRYDGPSPACGNARHSFARLTVRVGATSHSSSTLSASFAENLTAPLTTALSVQNYNFACDGQSTSGPEPWGGPGGELLFALTVPVAVTIPAGGSLVLELETAGNTNATDPAFLDYDTDTSGAFQQGVGLDNGNGCPPGPMSNRSRLSTLGLHAPGTAFSLVGDSYPPNTPVITMITAKLLGEPFPLPMTTPTCWLYVDLATGIGLNLLATTGAGTIEAFSDPSLVPVPRSPVLCGAILYVQNATPTTPFPGNPLGVNTSNYRAIVLGCAGPPAVKTWHAVNPGSLLAGAATVSVPGALAARID